MRESSASGLQPSAATRCKPREPKKTWGTGRTCPNLSKLMPFRSFSLLFLPALCSFFTVQRRAWRAMSIVARAAPFPFDGIVASYLLLFFAPLHSGWRIGKLSTTNRLVEPVGKGAGDAQPTISRPCGWGEARLLPTRNAAAQLASLLPTNSFVELQICIICLKAAIEGRFIGGLASTANAQKA